MSVRSLGLNDQRYFHMGRPPNSRNMILQGTNSTIPRAPRRRFALPRCQAHSSLQMERVPRRLNSFLVLNYFTGWLRHRQGLDKSLSLFSDIEICIDSQCYLRGDDVGWPLGLQVVHHAKFFPRPLLFL